MKFFKVEAELLEEYKTLLEIPQTREVLHHAKELAKIQFKDYIMDYQDHKLNIQNLEKTGTDISELSENNEIQSNSQSRIFDFKLQYKNDLWIPLINLSETPFEIDDLLPDALINFITNHTPASYHWYLIDKRPFVTKNFGKMVFNVQFRFVEEELICGNIELSGGKDLPAIKDEDRVYDNQNIIHMNRNLNQYSHLQEDSDVCEFLHYFFTFPLFRQITIQEFKNKSKPCLSSRFEEIIRSFQQQSQ
jgi:hypothetical protein